LLPLLGALGLVFPAAAQDDAPRAHVLHVEGPITAVVAQYVERGVSEADEEGAELLIVRLDTPGGSVDITDGILREMDTSPIPVVVWIGPRGAMAGSAGTFIALGAHLAAMAPGTTIGAASPVGPQGEDIPDTMKAKVENMLVKRVENLAQRRGEQAVAWARDAVLDARVSNEQEALDLRVVDFVATDLEDLLLQLDGRAVQVRNVAVGISTAGMVLEDVPMSVVERGLHVIGNPSIAWILLSLGMAGLIYEFTIPGFGFSGVVGGICLILGLWAMGTLPVNYAGVALLLVAFALFVADVKVGASGLLAMGGVVALVLSGMLLFNSPLYSVSKTVVVTTALLIGAFFVFAGRMVIAIREKQVTTGSEGLIGARGEVREDLDPEGLVSVWGEVWRARAEGEPIPRGESVEVLEVNNLRLRVRRAAADG
jgi:membrane-bound serine protease (ClpP class)